MYNQYPFSSMSYMPYNSISSPTTSGLLGLGKKAFNWNGFLDNAQRTLNVINQAMPIYNQVKPMFRNMGTVFKVIENTPLLPTDVASTCFYLNSSSLKGQQ